MLQGNLPMLKPSTPRHWTELNSHLVLICTDYKCWCKSSCLTIAAMATFIFEIGSPSAGVLGTLGWF